MKLIIGLGNPEDKYRNTRHNVGFVAVDHFAKSKNVTFKFDKYSNSEIAELIEDGGKIIIVKPQTFMNLSGVAVKYLLENYPPVGDHPKGDKLPAANLLVVHDEIDLPFGEIRIQKNISSAGHKGVQNIIDSLGTQDFARLRIGIESREDKARPETEKFVLLPFSNEESDILSKKLPLQITDAINKFIQN